MSWLFKFGLSAAAGILVVKLIGGTGAQTVISTTTDATNLLTVTRYVEAPSHDVVLVGSSLSVRISEGYFASSAIENLALAGGSPTTGLEIIAASRPLPNLVVVEIDILSRPTDQSLLSKALHPPSVFQPVRWAAGSYEQLLHPPKTKEQGEIEAKRLISSPPASEIAAGPPLAVGDASSSPNQAILRQTISEIQKLKAALEAKGVKIKLVSIPRSSAAEASPFSTSSRQAALSAFPNDSDWLHLAIDRSELRWPDGTHLDERSAIIVARAIEAALSAERRTASRPPA